MDTTKSLQDSRYDVIRTMALEMILICHLAPHFSSRLMIPLHDVFAQIGNCTFFALSGVLLGRKWLAEKCRDYGGRFVLHRIVKLGIPFLIFMIPYIVLLLLTGHSLSPLQVVLNLLGLSWFAKLPAAGHLWFVSAILIFYLTLVPLSRMGAWIREHVCITLPCSFVLALGVQFALWELGIKQAYLIPLLWGGGGVCFLYANKFDVSKRGILGVCFFVLAVGVHLLGWGMPQDWVQTRAWVAQASALSLIILTLYICRARHISKVVTWISGVSFEVYLVHCVFIEGALFSFRRFIGNDVLWVFNYFVAAFVVGWGIKSLSGVIHRKVKEHSMSIEKQQEFSSEKK